MTAWAQSGTAVLWCGGCRGDYSAAVKEAVARDDGQHHTDTPLLIQRIKDASMNTYMFLVHNKTNWEDLYNEFLPAAQVENIEVWAYLVPPSESGPSTPFDVAHGGYEAWFSTIAVTANQYNCLKGIVMDDFFTNTSTFTPARVASLMQEAHTICPRLAFQVIRYDSAGDLKYSLRSFAPYIDGIVFPYKDLDNTGDLPGQIAVRKKEAAAHGAGSSCQFAYPAGTKSLTGDYARMSQTVNIAPAAEYAISFVQFAKCSSLQGYHMKRFLVDGTTAWVDDAANTADAGATITLDLTKYLAGKSTADIAFELYEQAGVGNFQVSAQIADVSATNFAIDNDFASPAWVYSTNNSSFTVTVSTYPAAPAIPVTVMIYAALTSWHSVPPTSAYIAEALSVAHTAVLSGDADGVVTYCLDKSTPSSGDYLAVQGLYSWWSRSDPFPVYLLKDCGSEVTLGWSGEAYSRFAVSRSTDNSTWTMLQSTAALISATTFADQGLDPQTTYYYRIGGYDGNGVQGNFSTRVVRYGATLITPAAGGTQAGRDGGTYVTIPPNAVTDTVCIIISTDPEHYPNEISAGDILTADARLPGQLLLIRSAEREFNAYKADSTRVREFAQDITVSLPYPDADGDGYIDGILPRTRVEFLRMYTLNEETLRWEMVPGSVVNTADRTVQAQVRHLSVFSLIVQAAVKDLKKVVAYPNPYRPGGTGKHAAFDAAGITFRGLTDSAKVRIYTVSGSYIAGFDEASDGITGNGAAMWNARNEAGRAVASGMYLYVVTDDDNNKATGMIAVIK